MIYLTNAVSQTMFVDYLKKWRVSPNLSNQNFHNKLIKAISTTCEVYVISVRSINKNFEESKLPQLIEDEYRICWRYPKVSSSRVAKVFCLQSRINKVLPEIDSKDVVFVDTLNLSLLNAAIKIRKKYHVRIFGICTDNPNNISYTSEYYKNKLIKLGQSLDGYIVLTEAINKLYNIHSKPFIQIDGVSEEYEDNLKPLIDGDYIYFGGSLMPLYGVYNLIEAYKELNLKDIKLVLCGHHVNKEKLDKAIANNKYIVYLGPVSYEENLNLVKHSLFSINPRPINNKIDEYSIPSKTLECLSLGTLNITVENKLLKEHYNDCIIWAKSSEPVDLKIAIKKALDLSKEEKEKITKLGKQKVMERTSLEAVGQLIHDLII